METITYIIPTIHCQHCIHTIKSELSELPGVQNVEGDSEMKKITIAFDKPTTKEKIEELLQEINFPPEK